MSDGAIIRVYPGDFIMDWQKPGQEVVLEEYGLEHG